MPFDAIDGEPVRLFFLIVGPEASAGLHVKILSRIARLVRRDGCASDWSGPPPPMRSTTSSSTPKRVEPSVSRPGAGTERHRPADPPRRRAHPRAVGQQVRLGGWVHRRRDLGGLVFIDLRDRAGLVQLSCNPDWTPDRGHGAGGGAGAETVVLVRGTVALRPEPSRDPELASREVEVHVTDLQIVGPALTPAIPVARKEKEELPPRSSASSTGCSTCGAPSCSGT